MSEKEYLTAPKAAKIWGTTSVSLKSWVSKGLIPRLKIRKKGNRTLIEKSFVLEAKENFDKGLDSIPPKFT